MLSLTDARLPGSTKQGMDLCPAIALWLWLGLHGSGAVQHDLLHYWDCLGLLGAAFVRTFRLSTKEHRTCVSLWDLAGFFRENMGFNFKAQCFFVSVCVWSSYLVCILRQSCCHFLYIYFRCMCVCVCFNDYFMWKTERGVGVGGESIKEKPEKGDASREIGRLFFTVRLPMVH